MSLAFSNNNAPPHNFKNLAHLPNPRLSASTIGIKKGVKSRAADAARYGNNLNEIAQSGAAGRNCFFDSSHSDERI